MLSKWWHPTHGRTSLARALDVFPRTQGLAQLVLTRPSFPASPASGTIRCFTPKLTRGHSCDLLEGHPARALSQSWQTLLAICLPCPASLATSFLPLGNLSLCPPSSGHD